MRYKVINENELYQISGGVENFGFAVIIDAVIPGRHKSESGDYHYGPLASSTSLNPKALFGPDFKGKVLFDGGLISYKP